MRIKPAYVYLLIASLIWGATPAIMKLTLLEVPPFSLGFIRMFFASIILITFLYKDLKIKRADIWLFILAATTGTTLNLSLFFLGLQLSHAINAAILIASVPIFTIFASHIFLKEKLHIKIIIAGTLALIGVIFIIGKPDGPTTLPQLVGNIFLLASSLAWVAYEIIAKKLLKTYKSSTVTFYTTSIGAATFAPLFVWEYVKNPNWISGVTPSATAGIIYGIIFASLIAYSAWQAGLSKIPSGEAAFFFYLEPISGSALSILILGEKLTPTLILGGSLIFAGVILAEYKRRNHPLLKTGG